MEHFKILGLKVKDKVTGFRGVAESVSYDLYGCIQVCIRSAHKEGSQDYPVALWFDFDRVQDLGLKRVMPTPLFESSEAKGPADLPRR